MEKLEKDYSTFGVQVQRIVALPNLLSKYESGSPMETEELEMLAMASDKELVWARSQNVSRKLAMYTDDRLTTYYKNQDMINIMQKSTYQSIKEAVDAMPKDNLNIKR